MQIDSFLRYIFLYLYSFGYIEVNFILLLLCIILTSTILLYEMLLKYTMAFIRVSIDFNRYNLEQYIPLILETKVFFLRCTSRSILNFMQRY